MVRPANSCNIDPERHEEYNTEKRQTANHMKTLDIFNASRAGSRDDDSASAIAAYASVAIKRIMTQVHSPHSASPWPACSAQRKHHTSSRESQRNEGGSNPILHTWCIGIVTGLGVQVRVRLESKHQSDYIGNGQQNSADVHQGPAAQIGNNNKKMNALQNH